MKRLAVVSQRVPAAEEPDALPRPSPASATGVLSIAVACSERGIRGVMATVLARHGSAPGTPGQKLYLATDGTCAGTVGGGAVERAVLEALVALLASKKPKHETRAFALGPELGMCCGGRLEVLLEPIEALVPCLVVGAGHVATALAPLLPKLGFVVTVVDAREGWTLGKDTEGVRAIAGEYDDLDEEIDPNGICLVMTHDHQLDQRAIEWALKKGFAYVGGVGSRAKAERTRKRLEAKGFSSEDRARVRMPIGVDIGARLPEEIAISIAAELIAWKKR